MWRTPIMACQALKSWMQEHRGNIPDAKQAQRALHVPSRHRACAALLLGGCAAWASMKHVYVMQEEEAKGHYADAGRGTQRRVPLDEVLPPCFTQCT